MKARIVTITAVLALIAAGVALWPSLQEFVAVDRCLDRGGSYDHVNRRCDYERSDPMANNMMGGPHEEDSRRVMEAALIYLDQHLKAKPMGDGMLLVDPTSDMWSMESLRSFSADPQDSCVIPEQMYERVSAAATKEEPIANWVSPSARWLMPAELPQDDPVIRISQFNGVPVSTVVTLSRPGFSVNGNEALVILRFTWSIHDALARVRLEQHGPDWRIRCAQINYYV